LISSIPLSGTSPATSANPSAPIATSPRNDRFVDVTGAVAGDEGVGEAVAGTADAIDPGAAGDAPDPPEHPVIVRAIDPKQTLA
jgi:hypothetical protein